MRSDELVKLIEEEAHKLADLMSVDAQIKCDLSLEEDDSKIYTVEFIGRNLGFMIGPHGKHLQSLQSIFSMMINKMLTEKNEAHVNVLVDVGGYRRKRVEQIEELALRRADDARILGDSIDLQPMSAYDRRIVHMTLQKFDDIKTESFGEGDKRFVRIYPVSEEDLGLVNKDKDEEGSEEENEQ